MENQNEILAEIRERVVRVETKVDTITQTTEKIDAVKDTAVKARDMASSAHKRIDKIDKWMYAIGSTLILAIVTAVLSLIFINQ
ncbi:hemolysin XhlA family protein [Lysinibacillus macroides]|uniref:Hemolysin XhlA n=1 Tax=Lysinibacillus macroides TaxID=33935 RepID=A0A0N0CVF0_9BACI|nr:hemolysin XhlA family protein [Lysinibacillus macroides]KOY81264.1 hypothetical protein ADM90_19185 [Lysinibacillus macroides]QPR68577.1 hemolysin XhlA family protein [Lysinibacillus macroides]